MSGTDATRRPARIRVAMRPSPGPFGGVVDVALDGPATGRTEPTSAITSSSRATMRTPAASSPAASQPPTTTQAMTPTPMIPPTTAASIGGDPNEIEVSVGPTTLPIPTGVGSTSTGNATTTI